MNPKEKLLLAMYREQRGGNSDMRSSVQPDRMQLDQGAFNKVIQSLQTDGLIRGAVLIRDRNSEYPEQVILNRVALTHYGVHYLKNHVLTRTGE